MKRVEMTIVSKYTLNSLLNYGWDYTYCCDLEWGGEHGSPTFKIGKSHFTLIYLVL